MQRSITFYIPGIKRYAARRFSQETPRVLQAVSLSGDACALRCDHCNGRILAAMTGARTGTLFEVCGRLKDAGARAVLLSGGSDGRGRVPLAGRRREIERVRDELGLRLFAHVGLCDEEEVDAIRGLGLEAVLVDIIGDRSTAGEVYHLDAGPEDYERTLNLLVRAGQRVVPHIVIGLHYGALRGEHEALRIIAAADVFAAVLVILDPMTGTPMGDNGVRPPAVDLAARFFAHARRELDGKTLVLGCARPGGRLREQYDLAAFEAGFDGIAFPSEGVIDAACAGGAEVRVVESCCGLDRLIEDKP